MGVGSYFTDEFGKGSDDYLHDYSDHRNSSGYMTNGWLGWDPNAAGTAANQTEAETASTQDRTALLNQAAGINQNSALMGNSATRIGQSAQLMGQTAKNIGGLSDELGNAPSGAALGATAAEQVGNNQALSQAASARGANSALMTREAMANNDARDRQIASDTGAATANEMASRATARANILGTAAGVQNNMAGAYGGQASVLGGAAGAQTAAGNLISGSRTGDITQRAQDMTQNQGANQLEQTHADTMYAGLAAKNAKADSDSGGAIDSAFSMLSDIRLKTDVDPLPATSSSSDKPDDEKKEPGTSDMMSSLLSAYGGGGGAAMLSDERAKSGRKKLDEDKTGSEIERLLRQATQSGGDRLDTSDVNRRFDRSALDSAQLGQGSRIYGAPSASMAPPTARFADYQPPTARFADAPTAPAASPAQPSRDSGFDVAALDDAYRRERDPSNYMVSDRETKIEREKLFDMASNPSANAKNLDQIDGYSFRYKPGVAARVGEDTSTRPGIMAQDLEKAPAGKGVVSDTDEGKALDVHRALGFSLAGVAGLDKRMQRLEKALGRKDKAA